MTAGARMTATRAADILPLRTDFAQLIDGELIAGTPRIPKLARELLRAAALMYRAPERCAARATGEPCRAADARTGQAAVTVARGDRARGEPVRGHGCDPDRTRSAGRECAASRRIALLSARRGRHHHAVECTD